jgi:hypothetical protein
MSDYETAKRILQQIDPSADFRPQSASEWRGDFPLPDTLLEYYRAFGPVDLTIEGYGNPYFLPRLEQLWSYQEGYKYDGNTLERFPDWDKDWLAIADEGADPFIFSISRGVIFHAFHGEGTWEPVELFTGLSEMVNTFSILSRIVTLAASGFTNPDSTIRDEFKNQAHQAILELTGFSHRANIIITRLGWS